MNRYRRPSTFVGGLGLLLLAPSALAQEATGAEAPPGVVYVPGPTMTYPGNLPSPDFDPNAHLPSSSRGTTDINRGDSFDLGSSSSSGTLYGNEQGAYVTEGEATPEFHTVRRGETLWDLSGQFYRNPYTWPRLWAQNTQIQNPHWIYPGDRVRLREGGGAGSQDASARPMALAFQGRRSSVAPGTVFLRDVGWVEDKDDAAWGKLVGSETDRMILGDDTDVYIQMKDDKELAIGQELTIFRPLRAVKGKGDSKAEGTLVSIRGTARIDRINTKTHMARARITETIGVIERGCSVGPIERRFEAVAPTRNGSDVDVRVLASLYPNEFYGQHQVVFLDKGSAEGLAPGNRLFAVTRGDRWRRSMDDAGPLAKLRARIEDDAPAQVETMITDVDEDDFPEEVYGELRVLSVREHTATAIVTESTRELERDVRLRSRKGY